MDTPSCFSLLAQDTGFKKKTAVRIRDAMKELQVWSQNRVEGAAKQSHRMVQQGVDRGDRTSAAMGLMQMITDCHSIRSQEEATIAWRLKPYLDAVGGVLRETCRRLDIECPVANDDDYESGPNKKRRLAAGEQAARTVERTTHEAILQSLQREPVVTTTLTSAEERLVTTVIPESALLPDVAAMHDMYHPNLCLYAVDGDRRWTPQTSCTVHMGFYGSTILREFVVHRESMRRFTFVHLMQRMGFGACDINFYVTYVDDTFFRRVYCDARLGFLAESFSPRVRVYRGDGWVHLWDAFVENRHRPDGIPWTEMTRTCFLADNLVKEHHDSDPQQLLPTTILGALHRGYGTRMRPYDSWSVMEELVALESEFLDGDGCFHAHGQSPST
jgi:hypothetical protein